MAREQWNSGLRIFSRREGSSSDTVLTLAHQDSSSKPHVCSAGDVFVFLFFRVVFFCFFLVFYGPVFKVEKALMTTVIRGIVKALSQARRRFFSRPLLLLIEGRLLFIYVRRICSSVGRLSQSTFIVRAGLVMQHGSKAGSNAAGQV